MPRTTSCFRVRITVVLLFVVALAGAACGGPFACSQEAASAVVVTVLDGPSGTSLCGATVIVHDGTFTEKLSQWPAYPGCSYSGPYERAGNYLVDVELGSRSASISNVKVGHDSCHVVTQRVIVTLP
jgi:hypothetical protein